MWRGREGRRPTTSSARAAAWDGLPGRSNRLFDALAALACALALVTAFQTVDGLRWPHAADHFRDLAQAQSALDGHPLADPSYAGEWLWYNPLVPWLTALGIFLGRLTGVAVMPETFHVQAGPWVNLLGPVAFYALVRRLSGGGAALCALIIFLFFNSRYDSALHQASYSPWLFAATFAQGLFFLAVRLALWVRERETAGRAAVLGAAAGLLLLANTTPALVLGAVAVRLFSARTVSIAGGVAMAMASPLLYSIVVHYRFQVLNAVPMTSEPWLPASFARVPELLVPNLVIFALAAGGWFLVRERAVRAWLWSAALLMAYGLTRDLLPSLPPVVATFHFWRYTMAAVTVFAGAACWWLCVRAAGTRAPLLLAAASVAAVALAYPGYVDRPDSWGRAIALRRSPDAPLVGEYLRRTTPPDTVVLSVNEASQNVVAAAGRRVVALDPMLSNPYVDVARRAIAQERMFAALGGGDSARFLELAREYRVTRVVLLDAAACRAADRAPLVIVQRFSRACVLAIRASAQADPEQ